MPTLIRHDGECCSWPRAKAVTVEAFTANLRVHHGRPTQIHSVSIDTHHTSKDDCQYEINSDRTVTSPPPKGSALNLSNGCESHVLAIDHPGTKRRIDHGRHFRPDRLRRLTGRSRIYASACAPPWQCAQAGRCGARRSMITVPLHESQRPSPIASFAAIPIAKESNSSISNLDHGKHPR